MSSPATFRFPLRAPILAALLLLLAAIAEPAIAQHSPLPTGHSATPAISTPVVDDRYDDDWVLEAIRPELRDSIRDQMPPNLPIYEISVSLEPQAEQGDVPSLTGHLTLLYVNSTGEALESLPFRLYANGAEEEQDAQLVSNVSVDGSDVEVTLSESDSVLEVPFDQPLAVGATAEIDMDFAAFLPIDSVNHYGIFGYSTDSGTWALAHWYPVIAGRDPDAGWMLDYPSRNGDPIFSDTALYDVTVETEPEWELATTGVQFGDTVEDESGQTIRRFVSGPVRDFTIVADQDFEVVSEEVNGITVNSWFNPGQERIGEAVATYGAQSVALFDELLWPYPYRELELMPVDMKGAAGCEFPQLIYIGLDYYEGEMDLATPNALDFTVAHEVVHQWFYGLVGSNQYAHAFIDEGLTNFLSAQVYFERQYGPAEADAVMERFIRTPFERAVGGGNDQVVDQPTDDFGTGQEYVFAAYAKAPLGFEAIHEQIGDEAFFEALQAYVEEFAFLVASPDDLLAAFEESSNQDLQELWDHWFTETDGEEDINP